MKPTLSPSRMCLVALACGLLAVAATGVRAAGDDGRPGIFNPGEPVPVAPKEVVKPASKPKATAGVTVPSQATRAQPHQQPQPHQPQPPTPTAAPKGVVTQPQRMPDSGQPAATVVNEPLRVAPQVRQSATVVTEPLRQPSTQHAQPMPLPQVTAQPVPRLPAPDFDRPGIGAQVQTEPLRATDSGRPAATVVTEPLRQPGFTVHRRDADGSRLVIAKPHTPDPGVPVWGYREYEHPDQRGLVRLYPDGHRVILGPDYDRQSWGGYDFVRYRDGLRVGYLPDGRIAFKDRVVTVGGKPMVERMRYLTWIDGRPHFGRRPLVRHYDWVPIGGAPVPCFHPGPWSPDWARVIYVPVYLPTMWTQIIVRNTWVSYQTPVLNYSDPLDLLGDLQISSAFQEGYGYVQPANGTPLFLAPEVQQLRSELVDVQGQVQSVATPWQFQPPMPVLVSEALRTQMRKQVRLAVAMQQNGHAMRLPDLLHSGYAAIYLFQVGQPTQLPDLSNGADCVLQTGDLLRFDVVPSDANQLMRLRVEARGAGSCPAGHVVQIAPSELQDMLNSFAERIEDNVQRMAACKPGAPC